MTVQQLQDFLAAALADGSIKPETPVYANLHVDNGFGASFGGIYSTRFSFVHDDGPGHPAFVTIDVITQVGDIVEGE